jgi:hypothetical protein
MMVGARLVAGGGTVAALLTWMRKSGSSLMAFESLTMTVIIPVMPTSASAGVPVTAPVLVSMSAQPGRFAAENTSASPSGSEACGWKL